jgi:hypothetical protein
VAKYGPSDRRLSGPRRPEHLSDLIAAADVELDEAILDRIDQIVPPGVNLHQRDIYDAPALSDERLRRRGVSRHGTSAATPSQC